MKKTVLSGLGIGVLVLASVAMAGDAEKGKGSYAVCGSCHGMNGEGNQALNGPALAGLDSWYAARQLQNFKAGIRGKHEKDIFGMQMQPMAMTLADDAAVENVAAYTASLEPVKPTATVEGGNAGNGQALYAACIACHGQNAEGNQALNAPKLTGMQDWYLVRQLQNYKAGIRGKDPKDIYGMQMAPMAATLADDQAIKDVVAHIISLQQ